MHTPYIYHTTNIQTHKHTNTHIHTTHTNSPQREICVSVYACVMVMQCMFKMHSGKLDKDLTYCKGVIKPNFTYTLCYY